MEQEDLFRPYAPPANLVAVLQRLRRMNTPARVSREFLRGAGVTENIVPRVAATLRFLALIDEKDEPTDTLRALATATEEEYRQLLEQVIRSAYAGDFENIDPSVDAQDRIINAFQRYTPRSQHQRQVMLFLGLCREAGLQLIDAPRERRLQSSPQKTRQSGSGSAARPRAATIKRAAPQGERQQEAAAEQFLGLTLEDAALMPNEQFREVWQALGTMFRYRAQRRFQEQPDGAPDDTVADDDSVENEE